MDCYSGAGQQGEQHMKVGTRFPKIYESFRENSFSLGAHGGKLVEEIRMREGMKAKSDVIRAALQLYKYVSEKSAEGSLDIVIDHGDGSATRYELVPKKCAAAA
jgi:hypothetical protein